MGRLAGGSGPPRQLIDSVEQMSALVARNESPGRHCVIRSLLSSSLHTSSSSFPLSHPLTLSLNIVFCFAKCSPYLLFYLLFFFVLIVLFCLLQCWVVLFIVSSEHPLIVVCLTFNLQQLRTVNVCNSLNKPVTTTCTIRSNLVLMCPNIL